MNSHALKNRFISSFSVFLIASQVLTCFAFAEDGPKPIQWTAYQGFRGGIFYKPSDFYRKGIRSTFPEMEVINSEKMPFLGTMADHLDRVGVPVLYGFDSNIEATFDLYGQVLNVSPFLPPENIGTSPDQVLGRLYIGQHDTGHHFAGIPGLRRSDLKDPVAAKAKLFQIILLKEYFAVAQSSMVFLPAYTEWRDRKKIPAEKLAEYRRYNQGYYSGMKPMTPAQHVELTESWTMGKTERYHEMLNELASAESIAATKRAGVLPMMPDFSKIIGSKANDALLAFIVKTFEAKASRKRQVGFAGFTNYANLISDFYLQPWLVEWADDFQVGIPLDDLKRRTENLIDQAKAGDFLTMKDPDLNPAQELDWDHAFLRTEISLFARRAKEVRVLLQRDMKPSLDAGKVLDRVYEQAKKLHASVTKNSDLTAVKEDFLGLVNFAEKNIPINETISWSIRAPGVNYQDYWRNPYAYAVIREGMGGSHLAASAVEDAYRASQQKKSRLARWAEEQKKKLMPGYEAGVERRKLKEVLGLQYEAYLSGSKRFPSDAVASDLASQLGLFSKNFHVLVKEAVVPQLSEVSTVPMAEKFRLEVQLYGLARTVEEKLKDAIAEGKSPVSAWWKELDSAMMELHGKWMMNAAPMTAEGVNALTAVIARKNHALMEAKFSQVLGSDIPTNFRAITPPGYGDKLETQLMIDFVRPSIDPRTKLPTRSVPHSYTFFQEWVTAPRVMDCVHLLKQEPTGFPGRDFAKGLNP